MPSSSFRRRRTGQVSLERAISKLGLGSRTQAREWIIAGQIRVNGVIRKDPGFPVHPEKAKIERAGRTLNRARTRTFLLHKPKGVVTTRVDEKGRPTVFSLIREEPELHLIAVGRLDLATTGLLLLTNDTRLADWLTDPKNAVPRIYLVSVRGKIAPENLEEIRGGIEDEGEVLHADDVVIRKASGKESHLVIRLSQGKNREIRRIFSALGHEVTRLKRVSYGDLELGDLTTGAYRELSESELKNAFPDYSSHGEATGEGVAVETD